MSYNIGQFRRSDLAIEDYFTNISYSTEFFTNENVDFNFDFQDYRLVFSGQNILTSTKSYYIKFRVKQSMVALQRFSLILKNSELQEDNEMSLKSLEVKQGPDSQYTDFELIFTPNASYNQFIFELRRLALDFTTANDDGTSGRKMNIEILNFYVINNIVESYLTSHFNGLTKIKKLGIQGPPGMLFVLDGEEIRIGRSGIYELYEDFSISYIGFVLKDSTFIGEDKGRKDFFIMDFKY